MKTNKIKLPDGAIEFLSSVIEKDGMSLYEAITSWNRQQEVRKYLKVGDVVKIRREDESDYNGKKAFIGAVLHECGIGFDPDRSGKFAVYMLDYNERPIQGDLLGYELQPTGKSIGSDFLSEYIQNPNLRDSMREELKDITRNLG